MTNLVTEQDYRLRTQDLVTAAPFVVGALLAGQVLVEEELGRALALGTYTERLRPASDATVRPAVLPLDPTTPGYVTSAMLSAWGTGTPPIWDRYGYLTVTYRGGWTAATLPETIRRAICLLAQANSDPAPPITGWPLATKLGDISVSYRDLGPMADPVWPVGVKKSLRRYHTSDKILA